MKLKISYLLLVIIVIISFIVYFNVQQDIWIKDFSLNFSSEVIGILVTVFTIDMVIRMKEERERKKRQKIGLKQLKIPLLNHLHLLFNIYKASISQKPDNLSMDIPNFFDEDYYDEIKHLDFTKKAPVTANINWGYYLAGEVEKIKKNLNKTIDKYGIYLDSDGIDLMEKIINSNFINFISSFPVIYKIDKKDGINRDYNFFNGDGVTDLVRNYIEVFIELLEFYNDRVSEENKIELEKHLWRNDVAPKIGSARKDINVA